MKPSEKLVKNAPYIAAALAAMSAIIMIVMIILAELGCLVPRVIPITVETNTKLKEYDGTPLVGEYEITHGSLVQGHEIEILANTTISAIGTVENTIDFRIVDETGADVTNRYDILMKTGTLTIERAVLNIVTSTRKIQYNGSPLRSSAFSLAHGNLAENHNIEVVTFTELSEIGSIPNTLTFRIFDEEGKNVSDFYELDIEEGTLTVTPIKLQTFLSNVTHTYDGEPLVVDNFTPTNASLLSGHSIYSLMPMVIDEIGVFENKLELRVRDAEGNDVSSLYDINVIRGTITVKQRNLYVNTPDITKEYDGKIGENKYNLTSGSLCNGHSFYVRSSANNFAVGKTPNVISLGVKDKDGNDVTRFYNISYNYGLMMVTPRSISIETASINREYTGKSIYDDTYKIISGSLCEGDVLYITGTRKTEVGTYYNDIVSYKIIRNVNGTSVDVTGCYKLSYQTGTITIRVPKK